MKGVTEAGNDPQVAGLVYIAAGAPKSGESFNDWWKDYTLMPGVAEIKSYGKDGYVAFTQLGGRSQRGASMTRSARQHGTQHPPGTSWLRRTARSRLRFRATLRGVKATKLTLASSHVPMVSQPDKVADFILRAVTTLNANSHADETQAAAR
jgi:hypothetical protein